MIKKQTINTHALVTCAILTALVVILQFMGAVIHFGPFSVTLVLVPIVIGAALFGVWAGGWLGLVFGVVVLITDSAAFLAINPFGTVVTVILKGVFAGLLSALTCRYVSKLNLTAGVFAAAFVCPIVNTGIFLLGCNMFFIQAITEWGSAAGFESVGKYLIFGMVGINFLLELSINMILSPIIVNLINHFKNRN